MDIDKNHSDADTAHIEGRIFDTPLIMQGAIEYEPERYVAEKPYELTRYEYSILKRPQFSDLWFNLITDATSGIVLSVIGKAISALLDKQDPTLEYWEISAVCFGVLLSLIIKYMFKSNDDIDKLELIKIIENHFYQNKPRRLHLTQGGNNNEN